MPKLFMVVNEDRFFLSHRAPLALAAKDSGYDVTIVAKDTGMKAQIESMGFPMLDLPVNPTGMNPFQEFKSLWFLYNLYRKRKPDIVHHVGMKDILWGGLAARLTHIKGVVNAVSGLGGLFGGTKLSLSVKGILRVMRFSNNRENVEVIFQNNDDMSIFLANKVVDPSQIEFTKGSGIDLNDYAFFPEPKDGKIKIIFTARMVKEKGIYDLIEAAEILKNEYANKIQFLLCGRLTSNKTGISEEYMREHCDGEYICWLGERSDVKQLLENSHIMAFPSYYREGVPKSLIEASAIGRPIITCNSVGCRDVVDDGINGFLIFPKNPQALAEKLEILINDKSLREIMGKNSREKAEREFSIKKVVDTHLRIYNSLSES